MAGSDLHRARTELARHRRIRDDRDRPPERRQNYLLADLVAIATVLGMNCHRSIAEQRLGSRGRDDDRSRTVGVWVAQIVELTRRLLMLHLEIRERGPASGAPVDEVAVAVDEALLVEGDEHLADGAREPLVHGKSL